MIKICPICKKRFEATRRKKYKKYYDVWINKYCSKSCASKDIKPHHYILKNGKRVRIYEGRKIGSKVKSSGYWHIIIKGGMIAEHRMIMEKYLGRKLIKGEIIHHRNGDKLDNRIENLQLSMAACHSMAVETKHSEDIHRLIIIIKDLINKGGGNSTDMTKNKKVKARDRGGW